LTRATPSRLRAQSPPGVKHGLPQRVRPNRSNEQANVNLGSPTRGKSQFCNIVVASKAKGFSEKLPIACARRPKRSLAIWGLVVVVGLLLIGTSLKGMTSNAYVVGGTQSKQAEELFTQVIGSTAGRSPTDVIIVSSKGSTVAHASGVASTANIITGAALIIITVFSGFAAGKLATFQQMGFGVAVALLLDATLIRTVVLPSSLTLLGERSWYLPKWLEWLPHLEVEPTGSAADHVNDRAGRGAVARRGGAALASARHY
jgi:uncharacterized membrane protein YdfJ with MMPL/SSD domain